MIIDNPKQLMFPFMKGYPHPVNIGYDNKPVEPKFNELKTGAIEFTDEYLAAPFQEVYFTSRAFTLEKPNK